MKVIAKILKVFAWAVMLFGTTNLVVVLIGPSMTWRDNGWRIVITFLVAFGLAYVSGVLDALSGRKSKQKQEQGGDQ